MRVSGFKVALVHALLLGAWPFFAHADTVEGNCPRLALLVGNRNYQGEWGELQNTVNDAQAVGRRLQELGWQALVVTNRNKVDLSADVDALVERAIAQGACQVLLYYSGHGMEWERGNFLIPVDLDSALGPQVERLALSLQTVVNKLNRIKGIKAVLLDACRTPPTKGNSNGLAKPEVPNEMLVAYAADSGSRVSDAGLKTGAYAQALLQSLSDESLRQIGTSFWHVMEQVELLVPKLSKKLSGIEQRPINFGRIDPKKRFVFTDTVPKAAPIRQDTTPASSGAVPPGGVTPSDLNKLPRPRPINNSSGNVEQLLPKGD